MKARRCNDDEIRPKKDEGNAQQLINDQWSYDHMIIYRDDSVAAEGFPYSADIFGGVEGDFWI